MAGGWGAMDIERKEEKDRMRGRRVLVRMFHF